MFPSYITSFFTYLPCKVVLIYTIFPLRQNPAQYIRLIGIGLLFTVYLMLSNEYHEVSVNKKTLATEAVAV